MNRISQSDHPPKLYDLEERTAKFGEAAIQLAKSMHKSVITNPIISQFVRSATSVGANYSEADDAGSRKEFRYRISLCKRESRETKHWLRMIAVADPKVQVQARILWQEARELNLIFASIYRKHKKNDELGDSP